MRRLLIALLLPLAACQPLPHPFSENRPPVHSPVMSPPDAAGILVDPVAGAPAVTAVALAEAMADALRNEDVPADTRAANRKSYRLSGTAQTEEKGGQLTVAIDWQLSGPDGRVVGTEKISETVAKGAWRSGDKELAKALIAKAALALAHRVEGDAPMEKPVEKTVLAVKPVTGAPGDGEKSLSRAIADSLNRAGIALKSSPGDKENFLLVGKVELGPVQAGKQDIKITWSLARADGSEIGRVNQENKVPAGSLDGAWGVTAYDVALAATGGIVELLKRAQELPAGG
jgi:hypothetical protein